MLAVSTPNAPKPAGHYAQAVIHDGIVYVSGQLPIDPHTCEPCLGSMDEQTEQALQNLSEILKAAGSGLDRVIRTTVYIADIELWGRVNAVYSRFFGQHRPARTVVPTSILHFGCQVEIDAMAAVDRMAE